MPAYANIDEFMRRVQWSNDHFERRKQSSLHTLITELRSATGSLLNVQAALLQIPAAKIGKYRQAMYYLVSNYPGLTYANVPWPPAARARAVRFLQTMLPATYDPYNYGDKANAIVKGVPPTVYAFDSIEHFLLVSNQNNGVIVVHLDGDVDSLNDIYDGRPGVDHINSVLRVAELTGSQVCALHFQPGTPVCARLNAAYADLSNPVAVHETTGQHMGSKHLAFRQFVAAKDNCVVMGYNGAICVHANIFGAPEPPKASADDVPIPHAPLITMTNILTSRAVLMCSGALSPAGGDGTQYGLLHNTQPG